MKIYVHHALTPALRHKLAHNLEELEEGADFIQGRYRSAIFLFLFRPELSDETDGWHLLDWYACKMEGRLHPYWQEELSINENDSLSFLCYCREKLEGRSNWILTFFRTEKLFIGKESFEFDELDHVEEVLQELTSHHLVTDNFFINQRVIPSGIHFALTNTVFQWNETWAIRWYLELGKIHARLNFDWDLVYSVRNHKWQRVQYLTALADLQLPRLLVQRSDSLQNEWYQRYDERLQNIPKNSIYGMRDFDNLHYIKNHDGYLDAFFRVLLQGKMQILDESWSWSGVDYTSQYLSEKTWGLILAKIPFISTHTYPLEILSLVLGIPQHPFFDQTRRCQADAQKLSLFVKEFMSDFASNYLLCKEWSDLCYDKLVRRIYTENSLLDLILKSFQAEVKQRTLL